MKNVLSFKSETNGLPLWRARSNDEGQPHIVRLAAVLCDGKTQEVIEHMDVVIRPEGWDIPKETIDVHGITVQNAAEKGISESAAIEMFLSLVKSAGVVVSSNKQFNSRIIRIALKRHAEEYHQEAWNDNKENHFCAMKMAKDDTGNKSLSLSDALSHYTGNQAVDNHDSLVNATSSARVFFAINNK